MGGAAVLEVFATQPCRDVSSERLDGLGILLDTEAVMPGPPGAFQSGAAPGQRLAILDPLALITTGCAAALQTGESEVEQ